MSVHELPGNDPAPPFAPQALERLQRLATHTPLAIALCHKRRGRWVAWRWIDVQREVERLAAALREQGVGADSRLALSGTYEPTLLFFALAARQLGATLAVLPQNPGAGELGRLLARQRPSHAWVERREALVTWRQVDAQLRLYSATASATVQGLRELYGEAHEASPAVLPLRRLRHLPLLWVEEGSDWHQGLPAVLEHWLGAGEALAFPEDSAAATRDRTQIAPTHLLLSQPRLQRLAEQIEARLPAPGTWQRRLCDWVAQAPERGVRRLLKARIRRLLGFQRLQRISQVPARVQPPQTWLVPQGSRAA